MKKIDKYINEDGLVGIVYNPYVYPSEAELFDKELVRIVVEKDYDTYFLKNGVCRPNFNDLEVEFLKKGTKFKVVPDCYNRMHVLTEDDLFTT